MDLLQTRVDITFVLFDILRGKFAFICKNESPLSVLNWILKFLLLAEILAKTVGLLFWPTLRSKSRGGVFVKSK